MRLNLNLKSCAKARLRRSGYLLEQVHFVLTCLQDNVYTKVYPKGIYMRTQIQKWGNSLGLRIPMQFAKQLKLHEGSSVAIDIEKGKIVIQSPKYDLETMVKNITSQNQHHQILEDNQRGNEEW